MKVKIITGLSGSGKTTALRIFEDLDYYAMDNVPSSLIESFIKLNMSQDNPIDKLACVVDFRSCLLYTSPSPRDRQKSRMPSSA